MSNNVYEDMVQPRGRAYRSDQIAAWSHYREPIDNSPGRAAGNSRIWGDASPEVQSRVIDALIDASRKSGLNARETAYVLAIARVESGFNPDAAAGATSASGVGQFIDSTGRSYGLSNHNRFELDAQAGALVRHFIDNRDLANRRGLGEEYIYKYHHDGPSKDYGGLKISNEKVMPYVDRYEVFVQKQLGMEQRPAEHDVQSDRDIGKTPQVERQRAETYSNSSVLLRQGAEGVGVQELQAQLAALGYTGKNNQALTVDGQFGPQTEHAVREFQRAHGLKEDGIAGPQTMSALAEAKNRPLVSEATHPQHGLYEKIASSLGRDVDPRAVANITLQSMENGLDHPDKIRGVVVNGTDVHVLPSGNDPGARVRVDLQAPTADMQAMSDHMAKEAQQEQQRQQQHSHQFAR